MRETILVGIEHNNPDSVDKVKRLLDNSDKENFDVLLEYDDIRYRKHRRRNKIQQILKNLFGLKEKNFDEFYHITQYIRKKGHRFAYIDKDGIRLAKEFYKNSDLRILFRLASSSSDKIEDPLFNKYFVKERENSMAEQIKKISADNSAEKIYIVIGEQHTVSMKKKLDKRGMVCNIV